MDFSPRMLAVRACGVVLALLVIASVGIPFTPAPEIIPISHSEADYVLARADTFVSSAKRGQNYGKKSALLISRGPTKTGLLRFMLPAVPEDGVVHLRLHLNRPSNARLIVRRVVSNWKEGTTTWKRRPKVGSKILGRSDELTTSGWTVIKVTGLPSGAGLHSLALSAARPGQKALIASRETCRAPAVTSSAPSPSLQPLTWSPPKLTDPQTIQVDQQNRFLDLDRNRDYIIRMPDYGLEVSGGLWINGGHNIVLIGGAIGIRDQGPNPSVESRRGLHLKDQTGVVHIEGLIFYGEDLSEGIQMSAPQATVQLQNIRIEEIRARDQEGFTDNHPDLVQPWGGVKELRVDGLTGTTDYQGFFLRSDRPGSPIGAVDLRRVNVTGRRTHQYLFFADGSFPVRARDIWVRSQNPDKKWEFTFRPRPNQRPWSVVKRGTAPEGEFVPRGTAGTRYHSPGYC